FFILVTVLGVITAGTSSHMPVNGLYVLPVYVFWYCLLLHVIYHQGRDDFLHEGSSETVH
ncbi:MAG: hypothetical protein K5682_11485, partial [Lachnospiraceae bacterium]|nr:hypothetical protein [Lachnospiraceae bacterium]